VTRFQVIVDPELKSILPRYMELRWEELELLEHAIQVDDAEIIRMLGHKLKGTGSSYGFHALTQLGAAIEITGKSGNLDETKKLSAQLRDYLENVDIVYQERDTT